MQPDLVMVIVPVLLSRDVCVLQAVVVLLRVFVLLAVEHTLMVGVFD